MAAEAVAEAIMVEAVVHGMVVEAGEAVGPALLLLLIQSIPRVFNQEMVMLPCPGMYYNV